jgi:uncharacterized protein YpmS
MKIYKFYRNSIFLILVFVLTSLACRLGAEKIQKPVETIPVSTQAVATLEQKLLDSVEQAGQGGTVEIIIREEELTSLIALRFSEQTSVPVTDLQVFLREGQVQLLGNVLMGELAVPVVVFFEPQINSSGQLHLTLVSFQMGPLEVPDSLKDTIQEQVDQLITDLIQRSESSYYIESVTIADGNLTLRGHRQ